LVDFAVVNHRNHCVLAIAVQPNVISQVRRTYGLVAFAIYPVASGAYTKLGLAQGCAH
jgi:hypothetical protein